MNTATAILPAAALCAALLLPVSATADEAAPLASLMRRRTEAPRTITEKSHAGH